MPRGPGAVTVGGGVRRPESLGRSGLLVVVEDGKEGENCSLVDKRIYVAGL